MHSDFIRDLSHIPDNLFSKKMAALWVVLWVVLWEVLHVSSFGSYYPFPGTFLWACQSLYMAR